LAPRKSYKIGLVHGKCSPDAFHSTIWVELSEC
jgi:hypothetical protein